MTTASTVGYGDYSALNSHEKVFLIFLEFVGICSFSIIIANVSKLKGKKNMSQIIESKQTEIENYLYEIDKAAPDNKSIEDDLYVKSLEYIKTSYLKGVTTSLRENDYYKMFPPRLKNVIIFDSLNEYYEKFYYFFNDIQYKVVADDVFVRKILSHMDCQV